MFLKMGKKIMLFIVNTEYYYYSLLWCSVLCFDFILLAISLTPLLYFAHVFRLRPSLHYPTLPSFYRPFTQAPIHDSSIAHPDCLLPYIRASSWLVNLVGASALFVHVCCHVVVGVLCVVLVCEEHTCSLVSFVWNPFKKNKKCIPQIQCWNKNVVAAGVCLLLFWFFFSIHLLILKTSIFFDRVRCGGLLTYVS